MDTDKSQQLTMITDYLREDVTTSPFKGIISSIKGHVIPLSIYSAGCTTVILCAIPSSSFACAMIWNNYIKYYQHVSTQQTEESQGGDILWNVMIKRNLTDDSIKTHHVLQFTVILLPGS